MPSLHRQALFPLKGSRAQTWSLPAAQRRVSGCGPRVYRNPAGAPKISWRSSIRPPVSPGSAKPPMAMRLSKRRFREMTQPAFDDAFEHGAEIEAEAFAAGEPQAEMQKFFVERAARKA